MTNTGNRRRFLRTAAVAAAATTLPVVPAIAGEPDPIFTAIEHHRKAAKLVHKLRLKTQRQEAAIETKPEVILGTKRTIELHVDGKVHQISGTPFPARSVNDILEHIDNEWGKPGADHDVLEAKRWLLQSEFTNLEIDHRRRRDQTPSPEIKALRAKLSEAFENEDAALESLRTTKPNSVGGVAALLDYVSSDAFPDYDYAAGDVRELIELAATSLRGITATAS